MKQLIAAIIVLTCMFVVIDYNSPKPQVLAISLEY
jgi:hypothetical protein